MFKFVLCALLAVAVAEPGALYAPYSYPAYPAYSAYTSYLAPATTTITKSASSVVHPAPYYSSAPFAYSHFIKKRSAPFFAGSYYTPSTYYASAPYAAPALATPIVHSTPYLAAPAVSYAGAPAHFIKKRSVGLLPSTYIAPAATYTAAAPLLSSSYSYSASAPAYYPSAPIYSTPFGYSHFIKKRSAPLLSSTYIAPATYAAPAAYAAAPAVYTSSYASPYLHSSYSAPYFTSPFAYSTYIKK